MIAFISTRVRQLPRPGFLNRSFAETFPRLYLGIVTLVAITGYAYILMYPVLFLAGVIAVYSSLTSSGAIDYPRLITWAVVVLVSGLVSYRSLRFRPVYPVGLAPSGDKAPELFSLVRQLRSHYRRPAIDRIVITGNYELDIVRTPRLALPVWLSNTLVIGLPVMQCLSPAQFECLLAGRLGQFSMRYNRFSNWLYQHRAIWQQYRVSYRRQSGFGVEPLRWFFAAYAPFYSAVSIRAARQDRLSADTYSMQLFNDEQVREMITADSLCRWYIDKQYWPAVYKLASASPKALPAPHMKMAAAAYTQLNGEKRQSLMKKAAGHTPSSKDTAPSLSARIKNIGHDKARMGSPASETAAARYLGNSMKSVIVLIDKLWQKSYVQRRKRQNRKR